MTSEPKKRGRKHELAKAMEVEVRAFESPWPKIADPGERDSLNRTIEQAMTWYSPDLKEHLGILRALKIALAKVEGWTSIGETLAAALLRAETEKRYLQKGEVEKLLAFLKAHDKRVNALALDSAVRIAAGAGRTLSSKAAEGERTAFEDVGELLSKSPSTVRTNFYAGPDKDR